MESSASRVEPVTRREGASLATANRLLRQCGLPAFLRSVDELQPVVFVAVLQRLLSRDFESSSDDSTVQCQAAIDCLATQFLEVPISALSHISADKIAAGDKYAISCLVEILDRLCDSDDPTVVTLGHASATFAAPHASAVDSGVWVGGTTSVSSAERTKFDQDRHEPHQGADVASSSFDSLDDLAMAQRVQDLLARVRAAAAAADACGASTSRGDDRSARWQSPTAHLLSRHDGGAPLPVSASRMAGSAVADDSIDSDSLDDRPQWLTSAPTPARRKPAADLGRSNARPAPVVGGEAAVSEGDRLLQRTPKNARYREGIIRQVLGNIRAAVPSSADAIAARPAIEPSPGGLTPSSSRKGAHLSDVFPEMSLDDHTMRWMSQRYGKQLAAGARNAVGNSRKLPSASAAEDIVRKETARVERLHKERAAADRRATFSEQEMQMRAVRRGLYERRRAAAVLQKHYRDFHLSIQARVERGKSQEELEVRRALDMSVQEYRQQIRDVRSYADERRAEHARQLTNRLESVTQWYRDQFEVLDEELHKVRAQADDVGGGQQRAACKIEAVRRALALKLERKVRQLQADLITESDNSIMHRARDAMYFRAR